MGSPIYMRICGRVSRESGSESSGLGTFRALWAKAFADIKRYATKRTMEGMPPLSLKNDGFMLLLFRP